MTFLGNQVPGMNYHVKCPRVGIGGGSFPQIYFYMNYDYVEKSNSPGVGHSFNVKCSQNSL